MHEHTGRSPAQLMFNRPLRSRLIALRPMSHQPVVEEVQQSQWREFRPGQTVLARDYRKGAAKWTQAKVEKRLGTLLYLVKAGDTTVKRHVDQLLPLRGAREREEDEWSIPDVDQQQPPQVQQQQPLPLQGE